MFVKENPDRKKKKKEKKKEWVLKYDTSSYADIGAICKYLGNTSNRNILQYLAITDCDTTTVFYRIGKISPFKEAV